MLLSPEFEEEWAKTCHFYQRARLTLTLLCFAIIFLTRFLKILQNIHKSAHFCDIPSGFHEFLLFSRIFICAKLFCFFERNIWHSHSRNLCEFDWKIEIESENDSFSLFLTGHFNFNDSEWNHVNNMTFKPKSPKNGKGAGKLSSRLFGRVLTIPKSHFRKRAWKNWRWLDHVSERMNFKDSGWKS